MNNHLRHIVLTVALLLSSQAQARVESTDCEQKILASEDGRVSCSVVYETSSEAELELLREQSFGLGKSVACDVKLDVDQPALKQQLQTVDIVKSDVMELQCDVATKLGTYPMQLQAYLDVHVPDRKTVEKITISDLTIVGYPDVYVEKIAGFFNKNQELQAALTGLFTEYVLTRESEVGECTGCKL